MKMMHPKTNMLPVESEPNTEAFVCHVCQSKHTRGGEWMTGEIPACNGYQHSDHIGDAAIGRQETEDV